MILKSLSALIFPARCIGCQQWMEAAPRESICPDCFFKLHFLKTPAHLPSLDKNYFGEAWSVLAYQPPALDWIHQFKYYRRWFLTPPLTQLLLRSGLNWENYNALVPVPMHWLRMLRRGFNHSHLLAHELGKKIGKPVSLCLKKNRHTKAHAKLSSEERIKKTKGVFLLRKGEDEKLADKNFLLIDDVLTTGATVNECAKVLKKAGAAKVDVLTLARPL